MTEERKQELEQLLGEAMRDLAILPFSGYSSLFRPRPLLLPVNLYRKHLQQRWTSYLRDSLSVVLRFHPDIVSEATKSKLLDFIRRELAPFIDEDEIGSASYCTEGEPGDGFRLHCVQYYRLGVRIFLDHLLKIAIACGVEGAVSVFDRFSCPEGTHGSFQSIASLEGIRIETEIQVCEGVRLVVPFFRSTTPEIRGYLSNLSSYASSLAIEDPPVGKTLLIIDRPAFSIFHKPSQEPFQDGARVDDLPFEFKLDGEKFPSSRKIDLFKNFFCQALSLACNSPVQISGRGWFWAEDQFFHPDNPTSGMSRFPGPFGRSIKVGAAQIDEAKRLYDILFNPDSNVGADLRIPIDRWVRSKSNKDLVDKMIDIGIAFESIYLSGINSKTELSFRLRLHASWHLGKDEDDRKMLMKEFRAIYDCRSDAVHKGKLDEEIKIAGESVPISEFIQRAQDLCRQSIIKILEAGEFPEWNDLILG